MYVCMHRKAKTHERKPDCTTNLCIPVRATPSGDQALPAHRQAAAPDELKRQNAILTLTRNSLPVGPRNGLSPRVNFAPDSVSFPSRKAISCVRIFVARRAALSKDFFHKFSLA